MALLTRFRTVWDILPPMRAVIGLQGASCLCLDAELLLKVNDIDSDEMDKTLSRMQNKILSCKVLTINLIYKMQHWSFLLVRVLLNSVIFWNLQNQDHTSLTSAVQQFKNSGKYHLWEQFEYINHSKAPCPLMPHPFPQDSKFSLIIPQPPQISCFPEGFRRMFVSHL